jgi:hypothetical protein
MIGMFVSDKNCFYFFDGKFKPLHSLFNFTTGNAHVNQDGLILISNVITVAVAP